MSPDRIASLTPSLSPQARRSLDQYLRGLHAVLPLTPRHRRDLPDAIADLSRLLTSERGERRPEYLQQPRFQAAYLYYFLPWNLFRLARLFQGLGKAVSFQGGEGEVVVDVGAGPLTVAQALWIARPETRELPLTWHCLDRARKSMHLGRDLFRHLAGEASPWRFHFHDEPLAKALARLPAGGSGEGASRGARLVTAANVLNELVEQGAGKSGRAAGPGEATLPARVGRWTRLLRDRLAPGGRLLLVEPGVRLGGRLLGLAREALLGREDVRRDEEPDDPGDGLAELSGEMAWELEEDEVWTPPPCRLLAPCTHAGACPLLPRSAPGWCHTIMDLDGAPEWLLELADLAGLPKRQASLSMLLAARDETPEAAPPALARVVSGAFLTPLGQGRYLCAPEGLLLGLGNTGHTAAHAGQTGQLTAYTLQPPSERDPKSGARLARLPGCGEARGSGEAPGPREGADSADEPAKERRHAGHDAHVPSSGPPPLRRGPRPAGPAARRGAGRPGRPGNADRAGRPGDAGRTGRPGKTGRSGRGGKPR